MKNKFIYLLTIFYLSTFIQQTAAQNSVLIRNFDTSFKATPQQATNAWAWTPRVDLALSGPVGDTASIEVDYTLPDGKTWISNTCYIDGKSNKKPLVKECGEKRQSSKGTMLTGNFGFKIRLTDELSGTNQTLMTGKLKVGKFLLIK